MTFANLVKIIKIFLYFTALTPLILMARFSFPYVTVRTAIFRTAIEAVAILFLWLWLKNKIQIAELKKNYFFWLFLGLLFVELVAAIAGQSFAASFFSDLERMWGIFTVAHLFLFYFFARSFLAEKEWSNFFNISFGVSLLVSAYGIVQRFPNIFNIYVFEAGISRITSTLGNPTYVAIYLLFNIAFASIFFFKNQHRSLKYFYLAVVVVDFFAFSLTDIRGAYLGLILGTGLALFLYLFLGHNKKYKVAFSALMVLGVLVAGLIFLNPKNKIISGLPILNRLSTISLGATTVQTRLMSWNAAWQGFKQYPVLGVGMENFNVIFNKYFKASYYNLAPSETYFDRAHNQYLNLLVESGILALLLYLGFPILLGYYLIGGYRKKVFALNEFLILAALAVAYFIHIFFVFDDINSFLFFAVLLAFVEFRYWQNNSVALESGKKPARLAVKFLGALAMLVLAFAIYSFNFKVLEASSASAEGYMASNFDEKINYFNRSLDLNIIPAENLVVNYVDYINGLSDKLDQVASDQKKIQLLDGAIKKVGQALKNEIAKKPADAFLYLNEAQLDNLAYLFYNDKKYIDEAVADSQQAIKLSPERLQIYYVLGESYVISERVEEAKKTLEKALALNPDFSATYYYLGRAYLTNDEVDQAYDYIISQAIEERKYQPQNIKILVALSQKFVERKDYPKVAIIYEKILEIDPNNAQVTAALAAAYVQLDQFDKAIETAQRAASLDSSFAQDSQLFIEMIKSGQIQQLKESTR
jgi:O-antigen ligase/cytochrome c-type biogenesis protein CcmH/NrfG